MTVKENQKDIDALEKQVADLKAQLEAKPAASTGSGNVGFKVTRPRPTKQARKEIEAERGEMRTYRALRAGTDYRAGFIPQGAVFTTDQPEGEWMEPVDDDVETTAHGNQFAVGPDLNARIKDNLDKFDEAGVEVLETDKPRKGKKAE